jgi:hypothetical protein
VLGRFEATWTTVSETAADSRRGLRRLLARPYPPRD